MTIAPVSLRLSQVFLILCFAAGVADAPAKAQVSGTVCDARGKPVAHAYVQAIPEPAKSSSGTIGNVGNPWVAANSDGNFTLKLPPGTYRIRAKGEVDGYPDPSFWVNLDPHAKFPEIIVSGKEVAGVKVVLGSQGGIISGDVRDVKTSKFLSGVKIRIQDPKNPFAYLELFTTEDGHFQYTIASKPLLISVQLPGYKTIFLEGGSQITILPGEHREFQLEMEHD